MSKEFGNYRENEEIQESYFGLCISKLKAEVPETLMIAITLLYCQFHELRSCDLIIFAFAST